MLKYLKKCIKKCLVSFKIYKYPSSHPLLTHLKESILFLFLSNVQTMSIANNSTKGKGVFYIVNLIFLKKEKRKRVEYICHACRTHEFQLRNTIVGTRSTVNKTLKYNIFIYKYNMLKTL